MMTKTKKQIKEELKLKGYVVRGHCGKDELEDLAKKYNVELACDLEVVEEGWLGKPKGLLQVLWERGWIDKNNVCKYILKGKAEQMNDKR